MVEVKIFPMNPFQMNTYLIYDDTLDAIIIDPGNSTYDEDERIKNYLKHKNLILRGVYYTHCHIDHIPGSSYIFENYHIKPSYHKGGIQFLETAESSAYNFGIRFKGNVEAERYLEDGDLIKFGRQTLEILYTPGHAEGSICFYNKEGKFVVVGDVLFNGSIGRTDLPSGNFALLEKSIREKLYVLPDETVVYSGHGNSTTIGHEKKTNPFFKA